MSSVDPTGPREPRAPRPPPPSGGGLCPRCAHVRILRSDKGSVFYLCQLAQKDARFPRYPPQPVLACPGFRA